MIRRALWVIGAFVLWFLVALVAVPALIRSAYAGESVAFLNGIIRGQAAAGVERYLALWRTVAQRITLVAAAVVVATILLAPLSSRAAERLRRVHASMPGSGAAGSLWFALWMGCIAGISEALVALFRHVVVHLPTGSVTRLEVLWLAPATATMVFLVVALTAAAADRLFRARGAVAGVLPFLLVWLAVYSTVQRMSVGLHAVAVAILAAGAGVQATRIMVRHAAASVRFIRRSATAMVSALLLVAVFVPAGRAVQERSIAAGLPPAPESPDVLLIVWDAVRAPSLSTWGYDRPTTPELDRMAADGILFENAMAPAPWTAPSHASLFTGRWPDELSVGFRAPLDDAEPTLAEVLTARGYATAGFVGNRFYAGSGFGLDRGFTSYDDRVDLGPGTFFMTWWLAARTVPPIMRFVGSGNSVTRRPARRIIDKYLAWRAHHTERPYFVFINLFDAHDPYIPPRGWDLSFADRPLRRTLDPDRTVYTDQELDDLRTAYDACIRYLDTELGRLLDIMRADGSLDSTLVILTADHGEEFGEHGNDLTTHGKSLYLPALHVPLIMRFPALGAGIRRPETISLRDVPATVLDVLGLADQSPIPGVSLLAVHDTSSDGKVYAMVERYLEADRWPDWPGSAGPMHSIFRSSSHYIRDARGQEFLFDTSNDPWEQHDLIEDPAMQESLDLAREALDGFMKRPGGPVSNH